MNLRIKPKMTFSYFIESLLIAQSATVKIEADISLLSSISPMDYGFF